MTNLIPTETVPQYYVMNPATDDLLSRGDKLENGMIVLVEDSILRGNSNSTGIMREYEQRRALENNRWCEVTELEINHERYDGRTNTTISFVAVYADGVKIKRTYGAGYAWLIRKPVVKELTPTEKVAKAQHDRNFLAVQKIKPGDYVEARFRRNSPTFSTLGPFYYTIKGFVASESASRDASLILREEGTAQYLRQRNDEPGGNLVEIITHRTANEHRTYLENVRVRALLRDREVFGDRVYGYGYSYSDSSRSYSRF